MKLDLTLYEHAQNTIKYMIESHSNKPLHEITGLLCGATQIPILAIYIMYGHYTSFTPEIIDAMKSLQEFYKYDVIEGIELFDGEGFPGFIKNLNASNKCVGCRGGCKECSNDRV